MEDFATFGLLVMYEPFKNINFGFLLCSDVNHERPRELTIYQDHFPPGHFEEFYLVFSWGV